MKSQTNTHAQKPKSQLKFPTKPVPKLICDHNYKFMHAYTLVCTHCGNTQYIIHPL